MDIKQAQQWQGHRPKASEVEGRGERVRSFAGVGRSADYTLSDGTILAADMDTGALSTHQLDRLADAILADAGTPIPLLGYRYESKEEVVRFDTSEALRVQVDRARHYTLADAIPSHLADICRGHDRADALAAAGIDHEHEATPAPRRVNGRRVPASADVLGSLVHEQGRYPGRPSLKRHGARVTVGTFRPRSGEAYRRTRDLYRHSAGPHRVQVIECASLTADGRLRMGWEAPTVRPDSARDRRARATAARAERDAAERVTVHDRQRFAAAVRDAVAALEQAPDAAGRTVVNMACRVRIRRAASGRFTITRTFRDGSSVSHKARNADAAIRRALEHA